MKVRNAASRAVQLWRGDRGEGPMGYIMLAAILGMLGLGLAPLVQNDTSKVFSAVMKGLLQGLMGLFSG